MDHVERSKLMDFATKSASNREFDLVVVQHPDRVRSAGFGQKDRRPVDPPPILRLTRLNDNNPIIDTADILFMIVQCDLHSEDGSHCCNLVYNPSQLPAETVTPTPTPMSSTMGVRPLHEPAPTRNLTGQTIANACQLLDSDNKPGIFFVFPDLSVRTEGRFTLKFVLIDLSEGEPSTMSTRIKRQVFSNPFTVYSPKSFPGMRESTPLSIAFAKQGIKIAVRKASRMSHKLVEQYTTSSTETQ